MYASVDAMGAQCWLIMENENVKKQTREINKKNSMDDPAEV